MYRKQTQSGKQGPHANQPWDIWVLRQNIRNREKYVASLFAAKVIDGSHQGYVQDVKNDHNQAILKGLKIPWNRFPIVGFSREPQNRQGMKWD